MDSTLDVPTKEWVEWEHIGYLRIPYIMELLSHEPGRMVLNGYFYIEDAAMPVERIFDSNKGCFHVEIYEKNTLEDTSEFDEYDEEVGGGICFFPTAIIELKYRVIEEITDKKSYTRWEHIIHLESVVKEREKQIQEEQYKRCMEEWERESNERKKDKDE